MQRPPDIAAVLQQLAAEYPPTLIDVQRRDTPRIRFHIELVLAHKPDAASICDLGGGLGLFSPGCARLGMKATLADDFRDPTIGTSERQALDLLRRTGVTVVEGDLLDGSLRLPPASLDVVTSFDWMEHSHHSPKRLFHASVDALAPGGLFILGTPNCVNLRKRITVPLGYGKWTAMEQWYEPPVFRSHVREPDVADLRYIARDLGLERVKVLGRNWAGLDQGGAVRWMTRLADPLLRLRPSLCSDIYLLGFKPQARRGV